MTPKGTQITLCACFFFVVFLAGWTNGASVVQRRILREISAETSAPATSANTVSTVKPYCQSREPCGWAVYKQYVREYDYYMDNVCRCPPHKHCHRTDDDLTISAYVYTCIVEEIDETIPYVHPPASTSSAYQ